MIDQLKDLKDTYESARTQIDRGKEPLEDLMKLQNFLAAIHEDPKAFLDSADKDYKRFFFDDFTMGLLKRLTRERSRDDKYLDVIKNILKNYMLIFLDFLNLGVYNQQFFDGIKFLFEYDSILHNYNYQIPEEELKRLRSANQEWRKQLQVGDMVDAIADENNVRCSGWSQARISSVNTDVLQLEFIFDTKSVDRYLDRWSVEIAPFETKTKELWEWKQQLAVGALVDANDKSVWNKSTILDIKDQQIAPERIIKMAYIGYRVYVETGNKQDEKGSFEGWSSKFDEWISLYSPRIQPFHSKTQKGMQDDLDLDEDLDALLSPEEGFQKVYAVPRIRKCISSVFLHLVNLFGNSGGFELILNLLTKAQTESDEEAKEGNAEPMNLNLLATIIQCISYPFLVYHKEFIQEYGPRLIDLCMKALKNAPEKSLRDVRREKIESIIKSIDNFLRRLVSKDEREKQTEMLKLEVSLICLKSSYLERRIQGIRDLNTIIKNLRMFSVGNKAFTNQILIEWLQNNGVFNILFDTKKTHLQLVQRCTDIIKLLLQENMLSTQLMEMFWSLAKSDYKFEIYKIINDCSFYFKQEHIDFFFEQIRQIPTEKLLIEEFQCLSELGKYTRDEQFRQNVSNFFWNIICNSDNVKEDLVTSCINKFCEMVKTWDLSRKYTFFEQLTQNLAQNKSSIPSIRLFKGMVKDQKDRSTYNYNSSPQRYNTQGNQMYDQSSGGQQVISQEPTIAQSLNKLIQENNLIQVLMDNLKSYCELARGKSTDQTKAEQRKKLYLVNSKYSHHEEIDERLQFLKYVAQIASEYQISKQELGVIYNLLSNKDQIVSISDPEEFLTWCKSSCEQSSSISQILDLNEVGQFFTEKMNNGELDVKNLLVVGFDFLQQYFLSLNENQQKIMKIQPKPSKQKYNSYGTGYTSITYGYNAQGQYGPKNIYTSNYGRKQEDEETTSQNFKLVKTPSDLDQLDIVWNMALQCENPKVVPKAIDFLIKVYYSLDSDLEGQKIEIQEELIERCMKIIQESKDESTITRVIEIIKNIIYETEKKGTGDVKPHNSLLKGELLENILIKNKASPKAKNILMKIYSNATVWEFKKEVAKQLDLAPKYLKLELTNGMRVIKDSENGKTLAQLGLQSYDSISAHKITVEEEVPNAPLIGPDNKLSEKAKSIFNEWFDMYSDENKQMTKDTCALFIKGCTGEQPAPNDDRIANLFKTYDSNSDGKIEREEFLNFYETAARSKPETVRENLRSHNIRNDLKKLSEITEESSYQTEDMPRFKISKNQNQFDLLISLLDRQDQASQASWDLIQMLSTNQELYKRVLQLQIALDPQTGSIDWTKFFDNQSVYKLLYTLQIVEAVMEEGEGEGLESVVIVNEDNYRQANKKKADNVPDAPPFQGPLPPGVSSQTEGQDYQPELNKEANSQLSQEPALPSFLKRSSTVVENQEEDRKLRSEWTQMFLKHNGFQYILQVFMQKQIQNDSEQGKNNQFELKHIAFLLKLLRIFIMAAFSTSSDSAVFDSIEFIRRSSNVDESESTTLAQVAATQPENSRFKELQKQLAGPIGEKIIQDIDYKLLQSKILTLITQILKTRQDKGSMTFEDKLIIENALSLWAGCILHKNDLLNDFYSFQSEEFILQGLLYCEQEKVREEFRLSLSQLAQKLLRGDLVKEIPLFYLLRLLSDKFSLISSYHCKQYFELFCELIDHYFIIKNRGGFNNQADGGEVFNPENLLGLIIDKIKDYNQLQSQGASDKAAITNGDENQDSNQAAASSGVSEQEEIYIGLIQLTGKIIDNFDISFSEKIVEQKNLIDEIFVQFLFASVFKQDNKNVLDNLKIKPKSRSETTKKSTFGKKSKDAAYKLLNSLIRKSPLLMNSFLEKSMLALTRLIKRHDGWNYSPSVSSEKSQKYVGLRNLGCICYMNSMLQQFFMIPAFRYNLLCVDDKQKEDLQEYKGLKIDDNVLHQLQKLMAHLELSERSEYNPLEFCFAFKDLDGNPTNTGEQKDAQEFLNLSFDRIENLLRGTTQKYLLQSVFGGQTCSQFVCLECGKVKNRIEDFYNLSLTVKDIKSLYDSLQKQIEGEVINDYECDQCKKKVDISKRNLISLAPNVLIVHLQRITFNFETFRNDKINSFFEFPFQLDLKPYSFYEVMKKENRLKKQGGDGDEEAEQNEQEQKKEQDEENPWPEEETCYEYKLVGVNVHSGTANAGHYWSFINTSRGVTEPDEKDPNWAKTENDPWMKFNDSQVTEYNFEKLKEDCYGGDGKSGGSDDSSWSFGGSYGQSAYMLVYEKRQKRPIKILATPEEVEANKDKLNYDPKKEEYYKLIDYREGVENITPNEIYKQVFEDNYKYEFENDIYSNEFFEFVRSIITAVSGLDKDRRHQGSQELDNAKKNTVTLAKKVILDLLAKCFHNTSIRGLVESLVDVLNRDDNLCIQFLDQCFKEDNCNYLFEILLECTDTTSRLHVGNLIKFIINKLKLIEKDRLYEMETYEFETSNGIAKEERHTALSARFITKALNSLNTQVARSWSRFDYFLDIIYSFAVGSVNDSLTQQKGGQIEQQEQQPNPDEEIGLEFLFRNNFIEKACDFILGKKSPLLQVGEKRYEMGGSYNQPNFSSITRLITKMLTHSTLMEKYPLSDIGKKMFLHQDLLKVMLGAQASAKQFGQCLASMCKGNRNLSRKVSRVFIKAINGSSPDTLKAYLKALKPFLKVEDDFKMLKLEWIFGFPQINQRKAYNQDKYKYGLEMVDRINEEAYSYMTPLSTGPNEDSLFSQLLKCKGKQDTNCVLCLQEMLNLMSKDDDIARFVYYTIPPTYQYARYTDWIRIYLENQRQETERSASYNNYFKNKFDSILKSLVYLEKYEQKAAVFEADDKALYERAKQEEGKEFAEIEKDWLSYQNPDVIEHYPPQYIIGRQVADDREFLVNDEDPNVKVSIYEVACEYNYSNPTRFFNISLPHIEAKTTMYQTMSYLQYKRIQLENEKRRQLEEQQQQQQQQDNESTADGNETTDSEVKEPVIIDPQEQSSKLIEINLDEIVTRNWFQHRKEGEVLLKVIVENKQSESHKVKVTITHDTENDTEPLNVVLPRSEINEPLIFGKDKKCIIHLQKINPSRPFSKLKLNIESKPKKFKTNYQTINITGGSYNINVIDTVNSGGYGVIGPQDGTADYVHEAYFQVGGY